MLKLKMTKTKVIQNPKIEDIIIIRIIIEIKGRNTPTHVARSCLRNV